MKLLLYCTKRKPYLYNPNKYKFDFINQKMDWEYLNGKIVAECDFEVEEIRYNETGLPIYTLTKSKYDDFVKNSCLTIQEAVLYLNSKNGYAIHIKNLNIFDMPRELSDYCLYTKNIKGIIHFVLEDTPYILLSVSPEEMCRICNGEKTIEVRRKVLKEMLK